MATDKTDFEIYLKSKWDGDATKAAEADFRRTQKAVKDVDKSMEEAGYSAKNLKAQLMEFVALAEFVSQMKEGFEQVTKLEQVMNQLERQTKQNGHGFEEIKGKIVGFADQLKNVAGIDDDEVIPGMVKLYTATKNVEQAMILARIAADVAIGTHRSYADAQGLVMSAAQGNVRALRELGLSFESTGDKQKDAEIALAKLQKTFAGAAEGAKGLTVETNRMKEKWEDIRNSVVERVTPGISVAIKSVESFFTILDGLWSIASEGIVRIVGSVGAVGKAIGLVAKGDFEGAKATFRAGVQEISGLGAATEEQAKKTAAKVAAIWTEAQNKITGGEGKAKGIGAGAGGGAGKGSFEMDPAILEENYRQEQLKKLRDKMDNERLKAEAEFERNVTKLRALGQKEAERIDKEITKNREEEMHARSRLILEEVRLQKAAEEAKKQGAIDVSNAIVGLMGEAFGESKELAIASAIINTYEGATKALAQGGIYGPVLAAIVIAAGLAQVAKITSTNPDTSQGKGFDDPGNDAAARLGGRRWAMDMIGEFSGGASEISKGWAQGMRGGGGNTTNDNRRTFNVHVHGAGLIDPTNVQLAKQFKRTLDIIDTQFEGQRTIARRR